MPHVEEPLAETFVDDMLALLDHLGWEQVALVGDMPPQLQFAASHPERTKALVMLNSGARRQNLTPQLSPSELLDQMRLNWGTEWGAGRALEIFAPSVAGDARFRRWVARGQRLLCTADEYFWRNQAGLALDMRPALPSVQAPTLFLYRQGVPSAAQIPHDAQQVRGAKVVELPGQDFTFFVSRTLTRARPGPPSALSLE
jgi:pimeloyl-ACP methyl ester carboxylesterase